MCCDVVAYTFSLRCYFIYSLYFCVLFHNHFCSCSIVARIRIRILRYLNQFWLVFLIWNFNQFAVILNGNWKLIIDWWWLGFVFVRLFVDLFNADTCTYSLVRLYKIHNAFKFWAKWGGMNFCPTNYCLDKQKKKKILPL